MTAGSLLDATKDLGVRFRVVSMLPVAVLELFVLALLWSGAPGHPPHLSRVVQHAARLSLTEGIFLALALIVVTVILEPMQLALVRLLEGYWGESAVGVSWPGRARRSTRPAARG